MNIARFLQHWSITENPFKAEEARHDSVFALLPVGSTSHPDFEKILGDLRRPSTAIVFGEKGSGKTAIRLQLAERIAQHNEQNPDDKVLLLPYDDLNPVLDRLCSRARAEDADEKGRAILKRLKEMRLTDHLDGILLAGTPRLMDQIIEGQEWRLLRRAPVTVRADAQLLQALYDRQDGYEWRAATLRRRLGTRVNWRRLLWKGLALWGWILPLAVVVGYFYVPRETIGEIIWLYAFYAAMAIWGLLLLNWLVMQKLGMRQLASRILRRLRVVPRQTDALSRVLSFMPQVDRHSGLLPSDDTDEKRYAMIARFKRVVGALGYRGIVIVVDRIDEPAVVSGDPDRMRTIVWPMINNKFLQQNGIGVKLLLPAELRHELFRESSAFFQEARLDKQNLIERLTWTGASLYDLCNARLRACSPQGSPGLVLTDIFEEDVSRQDLVDALDQMHQPRDAFKLLYQCFQEHCSNTTEDQGKWRVPRHVLESVKKQQSERVQMLSRGLRPA